jgi:TRAP-type mannitol/chloroaromatic compound transport system substrate-binding protein
MSNGRINIDLKDGGAISPMGKEIDGIIAGTLDFAMTPYAFTNHLFKAAEVFAVLAAGLTPHQLMSWYLAGGGDELAKKMYATVGVQHIATYGILTSEIWAHSNKELKSLADIKGLKMRCAGAQGEILKQMGAAVVFMPGGELYEAAKRGTIDAFEYDSATPNWKMGFQEVAKFLYLGANRAPAANGFMMATPKAWNSLPDNLKLLIVEANYANAAQYLAFLISQDAINLQKFKDYGTKVAPIPADIDAELLKLAPVYYQSIAAQDPVYKEVYESTLKWKKICEEQGYR